MNQTSVRLAAITEKAAVTAMLQCYLAEFSVFSSVTRNEDGRYHYPYLDHYWQTPDRHPLLVIARDTTVGFVLARTDIDPLNGRSAMEIAEFYIAPMWRKMGHGHRAAIATWNQFPGHWVVRVLVGNRDAYPFWFKTIMAYTGGQYRLLAPESDRPDDAHTFIFENRNAG